MLQTETLLTAEQWYVANSQYLALEVARLRRLLQRRAFWLRNLWSHDPLEQSGLPVISETEGDWLLFGEDRQAEAQFYREDARAMALSARLQEAEQAIATQQQTLVNAGMPPALEEIVELFGLSPFERHVLLLCLMPELEPSFPRLYAYLQDDVAHQYVTPHLAVAVYGTDEPQTLPTLGAFLPVAPLRRFQLIVLDTAPLSATALANCPLRIDRRIADYLQGINRLDNRLTALLKPVHSAQLSAADADLVDQLEQWLVTHLEQASWPLLNLMGRADAGQRSIAAAVAQRVDLDLYQLSPLQIPEPGLERMQLFHLLEREAILSQFALYLDASQVKQDSIDDAKLRQTMTEIVEQLNVFVVVCSQEHWPAERSMLMVRVPKPDSVAQLALWHQTLAGISHTAGDRLDEIVQQFDLGSEQIERVVDIAWNRAKLQDGAATLSAADLWSACRELTGCQIEPLVQRLSPKYNWDDIILPANLDRQLRDIADQVTYRSQVYDQWGFGAKLSRGRGISALFAGPSGTGKTMAAEVLANHLQLDLYRVDLSGVVSKYIGETEKNLRRVFDAAEQSGAILFFDEADALFGKRTEVKDSHDRYANIEVNYLLQRMEDYRGLAILATNRKSALDQAFLRRLRFLLDFPFPDSSQRRRIWQKAFPPPTPLADLDYTFLSRLEITGGNIKNIALNAAFLAAAAGGSVEMEHLLLAIRREYDKIDKLVQQLEFGSYYEAVKS